jgi:hypothetical protein
MGNLGDEQLGDWPSLASALSSLPEWFQAIIEKEPTFSVDAWLSDLYDRDWIWWDARVVGNQLKIDLDANSLPISTWTLEVVVERAGGVITYCDQWLPPDLVDSTSV